MEFALAALNVGQVFRSGFWMKKVPVLSDISLQVEKGAIFGLLGANGAGKTTLIHLIVGLRKPSSGQLKVFGKDAHEADARAKIGYLPERPYFYEHLTGEAILRYYGTLSGMKKSHLADQIPKVLSQVGLSQARKIDLKKYSKGMLQRIGIAQAILHDPELLVLDEPMSGLDPFGRKEMRELILSLASHGRTILFSSHVIPDVEAICSSVCLLDRGKLVNSGPIAQFQDQQSFQKEVAFTGLPDSVDPARWNGFETFHRTQDSWRGVVAGHEALNQVLTQLVEQKAKLHYVHSVGGSLEDWFVDHSGKKN